MEVDFDKQIDTILRDMAQGNPVAESPPVSHLDADELSAFAENVLPPKARLRAMEHLADCSNCRKTLTTFVSLNNETESETIHEEVKTIAAITPIPWYRQLFAFPQLSYLMGALALVLTGAIGLLLYQNSQDSRNNVAMSEPAAEKVKGPSGASSEGEAPVSETYPANTANSVANVAPPMMANANSAATNSVANTSVSASKTETNATASAPKPMAAPTVAKDADVPVDAESADKLDESERDRKLAKENVVASKGGETNQPTTEATPSPSAGAGQSRSDDNMSVAAQQRMETQNRAQNMTPDGETKRSVPSTAPVPSKKSVQREEAESADGGRKNKVAPEPKATPRPTVFKDVAGKSFRSVNGIWTDTTYKGGSTTNVKRGSEEYKKLDSGLRSTADYLGGTVIIVWKSKNYKIQ